jgi:hypothetical protein
MNLDADSAIEIEYKDTKVETRWREVLRVSVHLAPLCEPSSGGIRV